MPATRTPRSASGSAIRPVPIANSSAAPSPASSASRSTAGPTTAGSNMLRRVRRRSAPPRARRSTPLRPPTAGVSQSRRAPRRPVGEDPRSWRRPGPPASRPASSPRRPRRAAGAPRVRERRGASRGRVAVAIAAVLLAALVLRLGYVAATPGYRRPRRPRLRPPRAVDRGRRRLRRSVGPARRPRSARPATRTFSPASTRSAGEAGQPRQRPRSSPGRIANAIVGTLIVALLGVIAAQLLGRRVALVAMALGAVYVPLVLVGGSLMSETLFAALLLGALAAAIRGAGAGHRCRWALLAGVLGGLTILTRANGAVLLLPLALAVWDGRPRWSRRALPARGGRRRGRRADGRAVDDPQRGASSTRSSRLDPARRRARRHLQRRGPRRRGEPGVVAQPARGSPEYST